jgi:hypothetical protein
VIVVGSRVEYTGPTRPDWHGIPATVTHSKRDVSVRFDREWNDNGITGLEGFGIPPADVKLLALDWGKPLMSSDGRKFITNDKGYGRGIEHVEGPNKGRQMYYGWLGTYPENGGWYYEDGTPARPDVTLPLIQDTRTMIDPNRPVQTLCSPPRVCRTIGVLERTVGVKTLLLEVPVLYTKDKTVQIEIGLDGKVVDGQQGASLTFINQPIVSSGFHPLRTNRGGFYGRGLVALDMVKGDYPEAEAYVEVIYTDGKATGAKFHAR